jgi:uncharacterized MAPEG superfamily protein
MLTVIQGLISSVLLTWVMLMTASLARSRGWTPEGMQLGLGNRENLPPATPVAGRANRAATNMLENLLLFLTVVVAARFAGAEKGPLDLGATLFFWGRLVYFPVYLAGIVYLRTAVYVVALSGIGIIALAAL